MPKRVEPVNGLAQLVVVSKVKDIIREKGMNAAGDIHEGLNKEVHALIDRAIERAKVNNRATVRPHDL